MKKNKISLFVAIAFIIFVIALFTVKIIHKVDNTNENVSTNVVNTENDIENKTEEESMQNVIQDNSDNKVEENIVELEFKVPADEFETAISKVFRKANADITVPGFRKGKAPRSVV